MQIQLMLNPNLSTLTGEADFTSSVWFFVILFIVVLLIVWLLLIYNANQSKKEVDEFSEQIKKEEESHRPNPDDLEKIEGIGPKTSMLLQNNGIYTYQDLANTDVEKLKSILDSANFHLGNPETWPEQAKLAAEGKWDELEKLQDELIGGKRE